MPTNVLYTAVLRWGIKYVRQKRPIYIYIYGKRPTKETYTTYFYRVHRAMPTSVLYTAVFRWGMIYVCQKKPIYISKRDPQKRPM